MPTPTPHGPQSGAFVPKAFLPDKGSSGFDRRTLHWPARQRERRSVRSLRPVRARLRPYRLRPDESGYENLVLAGDWTDCGMNAGCIEAAVMSGLEAANALLGRGRFYRIRGYWLP